MTFVYIFFSLFIFSFSQPDIPNGRWMIELKANQQHCLDEWWKQNGMDRMSLVRKDLPFANWLAVEIPAQYQESFKRLPCILQILEDRKINWRDTEPNDPNYINQADMKLIGMPKAWDIGTGGVTSRGDTIVVAIIDFGYQLDHVDLIDNIWLNKQEIPDDNIDNDGNDYIDDYVGVNIPNNGDNHSPGIHHGTSVVGVVGAKGNNALGVAGVNWNVKMMLISVGDRESDVIAAYSYVIEMRKKYRLSQGAEGAFVVVTNLSAGIDTAFAKDHAMWCMMYDKLGEEGILSVASAPNKPISVDTEGDMPTTCVSNFLISVTNVDVTDFIVGNAGFGPVSIDIGAPGHGTITTGGNNSYREFIGTSAAAPHVAGTIALMYSVACDTLLDEMDTNPEGVALTFKEIVLNTGKFNNSLQEITLTGKRLQTDAALREATSACRSVPVSGLSISVQPNPATHDLVRVYFEVKGDTSTAIMDIISSDGKLIRTFPITTAEYAQGYVSFRSLALPGGVYFVSLRNKKEKAVAGFFVR